MHGVHSMGPVWHTALHGHHVLTIWHPSHCLASPLCSNFHHLPCVWHLTPPSSVKQWLLNGGALGCAIARGWGGLHTKHIALLRCSAARAAAAGAPFLWARCGCNFLYFNYTPPHRSHIGRRTAPPPAAPLLGGRGGVVFHPYQH